MHACTPLWTGHIADDLDMPAADRKQHQKNRELPFSRIVDDGAIFAQPFSEGSVAAAGKAPFGTLAAKVDGGWVLNGKKIFASLSGTATYYGVLCTEDKPDLSVRDTLFMAVPANAEGVSVVGPWDPVGMRATVSRTLLLENVFIPDEQMRGVYHQAAVRWPHMFLTLCPTYMGIAQAGLRFHRHLSARRNRRHSRQTADVSKSTARRRRLRLLFISESPMHGPPKGRRDARPCIAKQRSSTRPARRWGRTRKAKSPFAAPT